MREAPGSSPYVCAKIAYLRGRKSQYSSPFLAYLRPISENFVIFLSTYSIFEGHVEEKKLKGTVPGGTNGGAKSLIEIMMNIFRRNADRLGSWPVIPE
jgi:hypothetical protein